MPQQDSLWNRLKDGDKSALKEIYDQESSYLFNYGRKIFQDPVIVEDGIHDLFVDIWNKRSTLGDTDNIRRYLAASLRRRIVNDIKRSSKAQAVDTFDGLKFEPQLAIDSIIINQELSEEKAAKLKKAFEILSDRQKEILYLKFYEGYDYDQISEILGIKYQSLRNTVSKSIKKLRSELLLLIMFCTNIF